MQPGFCTRKKQKKAEETNILQQPDVQQQPEVKAEAEQTKTRVVQVLPATEPLTNRVVYTMNPGDQLPDDDIITHTRLMYGSSVEIVVEQLIDASANDGTSKHFASLSACVRSCVPRACVRAAEGGGRPREWPPSTGSHCPSASRGQSARGPHWDKGDIMPPFHQGPLPIQVPESPTIPQRDKGTLDS